MKNTFLFSLLIGMSLITSCDKSLMNRKVEVAEEINLRGLFDTLHIALNERNPLLMKKALVEDHSDSNSFHLDSLGWGKELENFRDMNVRPGRLQSRYQKSEEQSDQFLQVIYRSNSPKREDLDSVFIIKSKNETLSQLRFYINYSNYLNTTQKMMVMNFNPSNAGHLPTGYFISGWQKLRTKDTVTFDIKAELSY